MKSILIIEDDIVICEILKEMLEPLDYSIKAASNGKEGLRLHTRKAFDLIITDIIMPEMEGLETIMALKQHSPECKIIAISGGGRLSKGEYLDTAKKFGAARVFTKPFNKEEMTAAVQQLLA